MNNHSADNQTDSLLYKLSVQLSVYDKKTAAVSLLYMPLNPYMWAPGAPTGRACARPAGGGGRAGAASISAFQFVFALRLNVRGVLIKRAPRLVSLATRATKEFCMLKVLNKVYL